MVGLERAAVRDRECSLGARFRPQQAQAALARPLHERPYAVGGAQDAGLGLEQTEGEVVDT